MLTVAPLIVMLADDFMSIADEASIFVAAEDLTSISFAFIESFH